MDRLSHWIIKYRLAVIAASLAVTVWLAAYVPRVTFDTSQDGIIPHGDPSQKYYKETIDTFGNDVVSVAVVVAKGPEGVFDPATLTKIDRLTEDITAIPGVHEVVSLTNASYLKGSGDFLETLPVVPEIPADLPAARALREQVLGNKLFHKTLVSVDGKAAAINIFIDDLPDSALVALNVDGKVRGLLDRYRGPEELYYAGLSNTRRIINETMRRDLKVLVPISLLFIGVILLLTFRSPAGVLLPLLNVTLATLWTVGLIGLTGVPISLITIMLPPLIIAVGSAYAIHFVTEHKEELAKGTPHREAALHVLRLLFAPVFLSIFTTLIGFGSQLGNSIPNIRTMGVFATAGISFAGLLALTVVPAILSFGRSTGRPAPRPAGATASRAPRVKRDMTHHLGNLGGFAVTQRWPVIAATFLATAASVWGASRMKIDTDFLSYFRRDSEIRRTTDLIAKNLAGAATFYIVIDGHQAESMKRPDVLHAIDDLQRFMEKQPGIDKTASIVDHMKLLHMALNNDDPVYERIPETQGIIEEELLLFMISRDPGALARYVNGDFSQISIFVRSRLVGTHEIRDATKRIEEYAKTHLPAGIEAHPTGTIIVLSNALEAIAIGQATSLGSALVIIFLTIAIYLRSIKAGILAMIPNLVPIAMVFGIMGFAGITLNIGTSIIASMALGIAVDDTIHLLIRYKRALLAGSSPGDAILAVLVEGGKPIVYTGITLCLGFLILALSDFAIIRAVGILTGITMITGILVELFLTPSLLSLVPLIGRKPAAPAVAVAAPAHAPEETT